MGRNARAASAARTQRRRTLVVLRERISATIRSWTTPDHELSAESADPVRSRS